MYEILVLLTVALVPHIVIILILEHRFTSGANKLWDALYIHSNCIKELDSQLKYKNTEVGHIHSVLSRFNKELETIRKKD